MKKTLTLTLKLTLTLTTLLTSLIFLTIIKHTNLQTSIPSAISPNPAAQTGTTLTSTMQMLMVKPTATLTRTLAITTTTPSTVFDLKCGQYRCPSTNGKCTGNNNETCICFNTFASYPLDTYDMCGYPKKKQLYAFLLEFFVTFGVGHFYTGKYTIGVIKIFFWLVCYVLFFFLRVINKKKEENSTVTLVIALLGCMCCCGMLIWQLVDILMYGLNQYLDGNGIELFPM